jgi:hypothetical protein
MTVDLAEIAAPEHTAIVTQELQGAVVGPNAGLGSNHNVISLLATVTTTDELLSAWT